MKKRLCFFCQDLDIGGVQKQLYYLLKGLNRDKYDVFLILCEKKGAFLKEVPVNVKIKNLSIKYSRKNKLLIFFKIFLLFLEKKPDIFISFHTNLNSISVLICRFLKIKVICCFPGYFYKGRLNFLRNLYLKWADSLVAVSEGVKNSLMAALHGLENRKIRVIPNTIDYQNVMCLAREPIEPKLFSNDNPIVISLGRLIKEKGFDVLIKAVSYIKTKCNILIIGDGTERLNLEELCQKIGLSDRVLFIGMQTNPYKYLAIGDLFVLPSRGEGLPTVILEVKCLKIPCICADYLGGTKGVIDHNINGYVFKRDNERELAYAIDLLLNDNNLRKKFIQNSSKQLVEKFNMETYIYRYQELIDVI